MNSSVVRLSVNKGSWKDNMGAYTEVRSSRAVKTPARKKNADVAHEWDCNKTKCNWTASSAERISKTGTSL